MISKTLKIAEKITLTGEFWNWRMRVNRDMTIPHCLKMCELTGRIDNFLVAAKALRACWVGPHYNDSDVFKLIEAISYQLENEYDNVMDSAVDEMINAIAMAQEEDGYIYTVRTAGQVYGKMGDKRWQNLKASHELYNAGHLYEAAVAHYNVTGKTSLLDIALKNADLICKIFGPEGIVDVPGHQEIEIGLVRLYELTGDDKYLKQAKLFLDRRGNHGSNNYGTYAQDHLPVKQQSETVGHAVRATYMYTGMAEVERYIQTEYMGALDKLWDNVVTKKIYLTGGVGARHDEECFGEDYELPNKTAYCETCASIGLMLWNNSMFRLKRHAKYFDVFERVLYNSFMAGVSIKGNKFFYINPLECDGEFKFNMGAAFRKEWFTTPCCPQNIARFYEKLNQYIYDVEDDDIYVNLYIPNCAILSDDLKIEMTTEYPDNGKIRLKVTSASSAPKTLYLRIPGWLGRSPFVGNLYQYEPAQYYDFKIKVNSRLEKPDVVSGYAKIVGAGKDDEIELEFPMPIRKVVSNPKILENRGKYAIERGPLVYCVESDGLCDFNLQMTDSIEAFNTFELINGVRVPVIECGDFTAVPYFLWGNSDKTNMRVWLG